MTRAAAQHRHGRRRNGGVLGGVRDGASAAMLRRSGEGFSFC
jgi:hypothetical protein